MLVLWDFPFLSSSLQPQDLTASKKVLETTLDLCPECRKLCSWRHQSARLILGSTAQHMTLLPNFGEVSGYSNQLPLAECLGSCRFTAVPFYKEHFPHHHCGQQHSFHQHAELRKVTARYGSTGCHWSPGRDVPRVGGHGSSPEEYVCQTLFKSLYFSKYTVYLQL